MSAFGKEAGPSASLAGGKPFSIFPSPPTSSTQGGSLLPHSQSFGAFPSSNSVPHPSSLRATWISEANQRQSPPPSPYNSSSGNSRGSDHSMMFLSSKNPAPGGTRSPVYQSHSAHQPLRNSRTGLTPQRRGESPYVWIKGETTPVGKTDSGINELNMKTHIVPPVKNKQVLSSLHQNSMQRSVTSSQKDQDISNDRVLHAYEETKASLPINQEIYDPIFEQNDYSRTTIGEAAHEISNPAWPKNSESIAVKDRSSIRISVNPVTKRTRPLRVTDAYEAPSGNMEFNEDDSSDRESQAKARRLARFKLELNQDSAVGSHSIPQVIAEDETSMAEGDISMDDVGDIFDEHRSSESVNPDLLKIISGLCPYMCPESERGERERKGDLDQYERLDGDRNLSSKSLAVKKYNRTAERAALLIRPMPVLQETMEYLLHLLDVPYDDRFLGLYNFLWDRMRAIRMDLRMQHLFNFKAIHMLEQMIRLHIVALHELCEYSKGEGFSEGFDAHLNIEQMNKTSVELFQMYDDHRSKGIHISTEYEFRGYYALLKLDKHPGYKVNPGELSLDLSKMTQETRQTPEVLFARDVARACRTGNFTAFFRLARKASYLQACLMHAHFAKLRTVALAAIHSGLQMNQGLPVTHVTQWLAMEDEDIESLLDFHGFAIKEFEEPYMVKEGKFLNSENDFPTKCSKLVHLKKSSEIMKDIVENDKSTMVPDVVIRQTPLPLVSPTKPNVVLPPSINLERKSALVVDEQMSEVDQTDEKLNFTFSQFSHSPSFQPIPGFRKIKANAVPPWRHSTSFPSPKPKLNLKDLIPNHAPDNPPLFPVTSPRIFSGSYSDNKRASSILAEKLYAEMPINAVEKHGVEESCTISGTPSDNEEPQIIDEEAVTNFHEETAADDEISAIKMKLTIRKWKRRAFQLKTRRNRRLILSAAALDSLTVGPFFPNFNEPKSRRNAEKLNIDKITSERFAKRHKSWSRINISDEISDILCAKNPHYDHFFWKLLLFFPAEEQNYVEINHWLRHKLMPSTSEAGNENVVYSPPSLSIEKKWFPNQNGCCVSFVRGAIPGEATETLTGASAIMFPLSESLSLVSQKHLLNHLIASLPSNASLPLVVLASYSLPDLEDFDFDIDRNRIISIQIVHLVKKEGDFLSNSRLRGSLQWLASHSPPQPDLVRVEVRRLVLSHLNILLNEQSGDAAPELCVSSCNNALKLAVENAVFSAECNNSNWPCPEIRFLESDVACHVTHGWSSRERMLDLQQAVKSYSLSSLQWVNEELDSYSAIGNFKEKLEDGLANYMVENCGCPSNLAAAEARTMVQKCTDLCLNGSSYYLLPNWKMILRRMFNWKVTSMSLEAYVLRHFYDEMVTRESVCEENCVLPKPSLDEVIGASFGWLLGKKSANFDAEEVKCDGQITEHKLAVDEVHGTEKMQLQTQLKAEIKTFDRLNQLLERCHRMLDANERKLSIYF